MSMQACDTSFAPEQSQAPAPDCTSGQAQRFKVRKTRDNPDLPRELDTWVQMRPNAHTTH